MAPISSENSNKGTGYIAFFDLDRTLINTNSGRLLAQLVFKRNMMKLSDLARALWLTFLYRFNFKETEKIISDMVEWVAGVYEITLNGLSDELFEKHLITSITVNARSEISFHKEQNAKTVILSSSILPLCRRVADYLKIDDIICSELEVKDGIFTGQTRGPLCFGKEKARQLLEYCEKNSSLPGESWYYGDSVSDFPVLNVVGHPVCINPDRKLKQLAGKNGWQVRYWQ